MNAKEKFIEFWTSYKKVRPYIHVAMGVFLIGGFLALIVSPWYVGEQHFKDLSYSSTIYEIEVKQGNRGVPRLRLNTGWRQLTMEEMKIVHFIQVGDSIIKNTGSTKIIVMKREEANKDAVTREFP